MFLGTIFVVWGTFFVAGAIKPNRHLPRPIWQTASERWRLFQSGAGLLLVGVGVWKLIGS